MSTLNAKITITDARFAPFAIAHAMLTAMSKRDSLIVESAVRLMGDRLYNAQSIELITEIVEPVTSERTGNILKGETIKALIESADRDSLLGLIDAMEDNYRQWLIANESDKADKAQGKDRAQNPQRDAESKDEKIIRVDYPSRVNRIASRLAIMSESSGIKASYDRYFADMDQADLIAVYRAFDSVPLNDDSRRMKAYKTALKNADMTITDMITLWQKIDKPIPQTRGTRTAKKTTPAETTPVTRTAKKTDSTVRPYKATPIVTDSPADDRDAKKAAVLKLLAELL